MRLLVVSAMTAAGFGVAITPPAGAASSAGVSSFAQCANGSGTATTCAQGWINGSIQATNSHFHEDDVIPQRAVLTLPADNARHTLTFTYQDRKGSSNSHAYDSLGTWNTTVKNADPCGNLSGTQASLCTGTPSSWPMSVDPATTIPPVGAGISPAVAAHVLPAAQRNWVMYGGTVVGDSVVGHSSPASGDDLVTVTVSFVNPTPTKSHSAVLLFGGHLAVGGPDTAPRAWGQGLGASSVSGGPYAFKLSSIDSTTIGSMSSNVQAGATLPLAPAAFTITKTPSATTAGPGGAITYTITVKNTGGMAGSTTFVDDYDESITPGAVTTSPSGGSCTPAVVSGNHVLNCTTSSLDPGASQTFTYSATMPTTFGSGAGTAGCSTDRFPVSNTAALAGGAGSATAVVCVSGTPAFAITKTVDNRTPAPGATVTYTITVSNTGKAAGSTSFTDNFDDRLSPTTPAGCTLATGGGAFNCTTGSIAAGGSQVFTYTAVVPSSFGTTSGGGTCPTGSYPIDNTATLASGPAATVELCVAAAPAYKITKTVDHAIASPGQVVTYTITVKNTGTAAGSTSFTDAFDSRVTPTNITLSPNTGSCNVTTTLNCTTGTIAAGGQQTVTYSVTLPSVFNGPAGGGACDSSHYRVSNTATITGTSISATQDVCVSAAAAFVVSKTVSNSSPAPGATVTYTITVSNTGSAAGSTSFTDDFDDRLSPSTAASNPTGNDCSPTTVSGNKEFVCTTGTIAAGQQQSFVYTAVVPSTYTGAGGGGPCATGTFLIANTVTLTNGTHATANLCVTAGPDFTVTKSVDKKNVQPGDTVTYTIDVRNVGSAQGSTTVVDDYDNRLTPSVPAGCTDAGGKLTCTTGTIAAGGHQPFVYTAVVPLSFTGSSGTGSCAPGTFQIANSVTIQGTTRSASTDVCVAAAPAFSVKKSADKTLVGAGDTVTYTVTVTNGGSAPGSTTFTDDFDDRLTPSTATSIPAGNDCSPTLTGNRVFTCTTASLDPGKSQTFTYTAAMPATFAADAPVGTCASGRYAVDNAVSIGASTAAVRVCVAAAPAFTIVKSSTQRIVTPSGSVDYRITVTNTGTAAGSTTFSDVSGASLTAAPAGCTLADATHFTCTTGVLAAGASQSFDYSATVPATYTGSPDTQSCGGTAYAVHNVATLANGTKADAVVCVSASARFTVTKTVDKPNALPGDTVTYKVTVTNVGSASGSTTYVDDYDDRLSPTLPAGCTAGTGSMTCTTGVLNSGDHQDFSYSAVLPATYSGTSGVAPCTTGQYGVTNQVTIGGVDMADQTVCVTAAPKFTVDKSVSTTTPTPGQTVTYTVTVHNTGAVAGSTTFVDDYDNRLSPTVPSGCTQSGGTLSCTTGTIQPGSQQVFTYTAAMPSTFTGASGGGGCATGSYPVGNSVTLANGTSAATTACVPASPNVSLTKTSSVDVRTNGDQYLTYTLTWTNTGAASADGVVVTDPVPSGTTNISCTGGCSFTGTVPTATWQVGTIAPGGGTGSVQLTVKLTSNQQCSVTNVAHLQVGSSPAIDSNTVTDPVSPQPDPSGAKANGSATGLELNSSGLLTLITGLLNAKIVNSTTADFSNAASSQSGLGGPTSNSDSVLSLNIGGVVSAGVLTTTSSSSVTAAPAEARQTSTSEVAGVCLVPVAGVCTVQTGTVRGVASTTANGAYATASETGSVIQDLKVVGLATPVDLTQTTTIPLNATVFGRGSYVAINENTSSTGLVSGKYVGDESVTMIHLKITGVLGGVQAVELKVASATAHSEFPQTFVCSTTHNQALSGNAYVARLFTGPLLADLLQGYVQIAPLGGNETEHVAGVALPANGSVLGAAVADSHSDGALTATASTSRSYAEVAGDGSGPLCVLGNAGSCVVSATTVRSEARSSGTSSGSSSSDTGTQLVGLKVLGVPISGTPAPNTVINLPGIGFVILNEQFCDAGGAANHACIGAKHSGITIRSIRVVVTVANNLLGLNPGVEVDVAQAHADSSFG
ncbi:choice-of-anchor P family protein [Nocardioides ultimimeridianus]